MSVRVATKYDERQGGYVVNLDKEMLENAPTYGVNEGFPLAADKSISTTTRLPTGDSGSPTDPPVFADWRAFLRRSAIGATARLRCRCRSRARQGASYEMLFNYCCCCLQRRTGRVQRYARA